MQGTDPLVSAISKLASALPENPRLLLRLSRAAATAKVDPGAQRPRNVMQVIGAFCELQRMVENATTLLEKEGVSVGGIDSSMHLIFHGTLLGSIDAKFFEKILEEK